MTLSSILLCLSLAWLNLLSGALAQGVCSSSTYSTLLGLSTYAPAESYCSKNFPVAKVKTTVTVTSTASGVTTATVEINKRTLERRAKTTITVTSTSTCAGACATLSSITATQPVAFVSTFCSCIESQSTQTVTKTVSSKSTKTKTITTVTTVAPSPTNEITDGGFENGGVSWGFGGASVDCSGTDAYSGSCAAVFPPQPNTEGNAGQSPTTSPGPAYCNLALGYIGTSNDTIVPNFKLYVDGTAVASLYACGDGSGDVTGGTQPCILDGQAHYFPLTIDYTQTSEYSYTDFAFTFLFSDPNANTNTLTGLIDAVSCQLSS